MTYQEAVARAERLYALGGLWPTVTKKDEPGEWDVIVSVTVETWERK